MPTLASLCSLARASQATSAGPCCGNRGKSHVLKASDTLTATLTVRRIGKTEETIMSNRPVPRWALVLLTAGTLILPIVLAVLWGVATLLGGLGDADGSSALKYLGVACGVLWAVILVLLVVAQGINSLSDSHSDSDQDESGKPSG